MFNGRVRNVGEGGGAVAGGVVSGAVGGGGEAGIDVAWGAVASPEGIFIPLESFGFPLLSGLGGFGLLFFVVAFDHLGRREKIEWISVGIVFIYNFG